MMLNLNNKIIVLLGNAKSVLNKQRSIDNRFDIICRMNKGLPLFLEKYIGSRTDVLFLSLALSENDIKEFKAKNVIICSPKIFITDYAHSRYSLNDWTKLFLKLKARPSTGIMAFDYILQIGGFKTLTLIGFDFWKTPNWYTNNVHLGKHSPKAEKEYIEQKIKEYNGRIILEK